MDDVYNRAGSITRVRQTTLSKNNSSASLAEDRVGLAARGIADMSKPDWEQARDYLDRSRREEAESLLHIAAAQGGTEAQFKLGLMYYDGECVQQDYRQAAEWFLKAAEQGHAKSQFNLGLMYDNGECTQQDCSQAAEWFLKAAEQGNVAAQFTLGVMYSDGEGVQQDYIQAAAWFLKAAEQGDADAQNNVGAAYHNGKGMPQNYELALG